jgi:hypothetical protein
MVRPLQPISSLSYSNDYAAETSVSLTRSDGARVFTISNRSSDGAVVFTISNGSSDGAAVFTISDGSENDRAYISGDVVPAKRCYTSTMNDSVGEGRCCGYTPREENLVPETVFRLT